MTRTSASDRSMRLRMPIKDRSSTAPVAPVDPTLPAFDGHDGERRRVNVGFAARAREIPAVHSGP